MTEIRNYDTADLVAKAAAENAVEILKLAIESKGSASWVLAGGSSPLAAYKYVVKEYADALDWSLVTLIMGDERFVPLGHADSNWGAIIKIFDAHGLTARVQRIAPDILETVEATADAYESSIRYAGIENFDLVWLGVGEDGHTLSLFPGNDGFTFATDSWVIPVYDSPKAPSMRISLSLSALQHIVELVIFATGAAKRDILRTARLMGGLPISVAAETAESYGAEVRWLYDDAAWE